MATRLQELGERIHVDAFNTELACLPGRYTPPRIGHHFFTLVRHPELAIGVLKLSKDRFFEIARIARHGGRDVIPIGKGSPINKVF
jgi:hypothetical protein